MAQASACQALPEQGSLGGTGGGARAYVKWPGAFPSRLRLAQARTLRTKAKRVRTTAPQEKQPPRNCRTGPRRGRETARNGAWNSWGLP